MDYSNIRIENQTLDYWWNYLVSFGLKVVAAIVIFIIGRFLIRWIVRTTDKVMKNRGIDPAVTSFVRSLLNVTLLILLGLAILSKLGVEVVSFAALLASMGVAIGMALSSDLKNLAGGIVLLITRPIRVGDFIETSAGSGTVKEIQIFHTILLTTNNQRLYVPNGVMSSSAITNYSMEPIRRLKWIVGVEYDTDVAEVRQELETLLAAEKRLLSDPAPEINVDKLNDSSVDILVTAWCQRGDYWDIYYSFNEKLYKEFNDKGISFPFPTVTVHRKES